MIGELTTSAEEWHRRFWELACHVATWSKDPDKKVGAVCVDDLRRVVSMGYNGFPRGVPDIKDRMKDKTFKRRLMVHAEVNAILNSPTSLRGCAIYSTSFPCGESCAPAIIQSGITLVVAPQPRGDSSWSDSWRLSHDILLEAGVTIIPLDIQERGNI